MKAEYEQTIEIAAGSDRVWEVMSDVERWPEWTASMRAVQLLDSGGLRPGQRARIRQPRLPVAIWTVQGIEHGRSFTWRSEAAGLSSFAEHSVQPQGQDRSRVVLRLGQEGVLAGLVRLTHGGLIRRYLRLEAEGFERAARAQRP